MSVATPAVDVARVRLCPWWPCSFGAGCLQDEGLGCSGLSSEQLGAAVGSARRAVAGRGCQAQAAATAPVSPVPVSQLDAEPLGSGRCSRCSPWSRASRGGGQSTGGAAPALPSPPLRSYAVAFDAVPGPPAPREHRCSLDVAPAPTGDAARCQPRSRTTGPRCKSRLLGCSSKMPGLPRVPAAAFCSTVLFPRRSQASPLPAPLESLTLRGETATPWCPWARTRHDSPAQPTLGLGPGRGRGAGTAHPPEPFSQGRASCRPHPSPRSPRPLRVPGCSQLQSRARAPAEGGSWVLLGYVVPCRRFPEEYFFPSLKTAAAGPACVRAAKYHLIAAGAGGFICWGMIVLPIY